MLEARTGLGSIKSFPRPGVKSKLATSTKSSMGLQNKTFYCEICDVHVNSDTQLKQVRDIFKLTFFYLSSYIPGPKKKKKRRQPEIQNQFFRNSSKMI